MADRYDRARTTSCGEPAYSYCFDGFQTVRRAIAYRPELPQLQSRGPAEYPTPVLPAKGRVTAGARTRDLLSSATIRCRRLQPALLCPVIWLIYRVLGDSEECVCLLRTSPYRPGCSTVAVRRGVREGEHRGEFTRSAWFEAIARGLGLSVSWPHTPARRSPPVRSSGK